MSKLIHNIIKKIFDIIKQYKFGYEKMLAGNKWDLRLLKLLSVLIILAFSAQALTEWIDPPKPVLIDYTLTRILPIFMVFIFAVIMLTVTSQLYSVYLLLAIVFFHVGFNGYLLGHELAGFRLPLDEQIGTGRMVDYIFMAFPSTAIFALFFSRLWAIYLWLGLSFFRPVKEYLVLTSNENTFASSNWAEIISNGYAINQWALADNSMTTILFIIIVIAIAHFNRWVMGANIKTETENANLGRYFSPDVKEEIKHGGIDIQKSKPKDMNVAVLFRDIVNFTQLSEKMNPSDVLVLLSDYQSIMVEAIFENNGTVDKFIGDAVMANFGTPKSYGNDAQNAFDCAVAMNVKLDNLNKKRKQANQFVIEHRIGIHYGTCVVGNMGSKQRVEFAVIGDTVNVASRICSACKEFDTNFLISDELAQMINYDLPSKKISDYLIRGRNEPLDLVKIYQ